MRVTLVLGEDNPYILRSAIHLATCLRELGQYEQARQLGEDTLTRSRRLLGEDHPDTLTSRRHLASAYQSAGRLDQAITLYEVPPVARTPPVWGQ